MSGVNSGLYVCLKCHGKKEKNSVFRIYMNKKKVLIYSKIEITSGEYKLINKYSYSRQVLRYYIVIIREKICDIEVTI